ncbi:YybS family protein [Peribacillus cavernae]|uniref:YybS family protein n=1 Tax=Peribacillus cavernae TaxID=1674310 RepID=UPI00163C167B|nr:YybS family protein [Peribacillus cavernae]MDQ0220956.1 uncharacterized protein YybS (DUF2232 family) [Peribacillus cavernae]
MNNGRKIAEGGALLALYSILLFLTVQVPFLGAVLLFFLPVPFILTAVKQKLTWSIGFLFAACLLAALFGTIFAIPMALITGLTGITIGYLLKRDKPAFIIYISAVLTFLAGVLVLYGVSVWFLGINYLQDFTEVLRESIDKSFEIMTAIGQEPQESVQKSLYASIDMLDTILPALLIVSSMVMVALFFLASHPILKRFSERKVSWSPLRELQLPKSLLWYYLITMITTYFLKPEENSFFFMAVANLLVILQLLMLLQGYSLLFFFSYIKGWAKPVPITILVISLFLPLFQSIIRILGILDLGFSFRETLQKKK